MTLPSIRFNVLIILILTYIGQVLTISDGTVLLNIAVWLISYYCYTRFKTYSASISLQADGTAINRLADGLLILAYYLPATAIISNFTSYFSGVNPALASLLSLISHYGYLSLLFIAIYFLHSGSVRLIPITNKLEIRLPQYIISLVALIIGIAAASVLVLGPLTNLSNMAGQFHFPLWYLIATVALPYIYIIFLTTKLLHNIQFYNYYITGVIYRQAFNLTSIGLTIIIVSIVARRLAVWFNNYNGYPTEAGLSVVALFTIGLIVAGYLLVAAGAKRLQRIEQA